MYAQYAENSGVERVDEEISAENLQFTTLRQQMLQQQKADAGESYPDTIERYRAEQLSHTQRLDPRLGLGNMRQPMGLRRTSEMLLKEKEKEKAQRLAEHVTALDADGLPSSELANPSVSVRQFPGSSMQTQRRGPAVVQHGSSEEYTSLSSSSSSSSSSGSASRSARTGSLDVLKEDGEDGAEPALWQS
jgi:hypothetical protein